MKIDVTVKIKRCFSVWMGVLNAERLGQRSEVRLQSSEYALRSTLHASRAFTLIEVLVAMTVLAVMVLMAANIFQSSSAAWNIGTQKSDMNTAARAALDFMARELAGAVAGEVEATTTPAVTPSFQVIGGNEVRFASLVGDVNNGGRALRNGAFYLNPDSQLMYAHQLASPYAALPNQDGAGMLVTNVLALYFYVYINEADLAGSGTGAYNSNSLPLCLDIALEMLSDDDMQKYAGDADFRARNAKLYSTRVYFPNRQGYQAR